MPNMSPVKNEMPCQDPNVRNKNFEEVSFGYTAEVAMEEAKRCLNCNHKPCMDGCPVHIDIPGFIQEVANGNFEEAFYILSKSTALPAVCGRVCPQESQCEKFCVRGIKGESVGIGRLERFVADWYRENKEFVANKKPANGHKAAIIGSGPAGLACAKDLLVEGFDVTMFEALHTAGGVLVYGIPEFRLPKAIVKKEIQNLESLGLDLKLNTVIGRTMTIDDLKEQGYEAIFIGSGAGLPNFMNIPGINANGVYSANEYLTRVNLMKSYREDVDTPIQHANKVAVVGGGNVAMDAARSAKRLGADHVYIVYRRGMEELPARHEEIEHAQEEGIEFLTLENPTEIIANDKGWVTGMNCTKMELGEPDASGRRRPVEIIGSDHILDVDSVIMAIGTSPNPLIKMTTDGLETNNWGCIVVDEKEQTSIENIYAGGDVVSGAATVILAMGAGKDAAKSIVESFK